MKQIQEAIRSCLPNTVRLRRALHQCPELEFEEIQTTAAIRQELARLGIHRILEIASLPTATVALIGDPAKPCLALRADIDALPITEATGVQYASMNPGRMHACGHDGHAAGLLGAAAILKDLESELPVCVKLIFQPAEEPGAGGGAEKLVEAGVLDGRIGPKVEAIFGLHGWPGLPVGTVATRPGPLMAATDTFIVTFRGRGAHGAFPHLGRDPIVAAAEGILTLQQIISREISPVEPALITVGQIAAGTAINIIPELAVFRGTLRTLTPGTRLYIKAALARRMQGIATAHDLQSEVQWEQGYPATDNTPALADYVAAIAKREIGPNAFILAAAPSMGGEDFGYYIEKVPGCFFLVGLRPADGPDIPGLHHPQFNYNDDALPTAIRMFVGLVMNYPAMLIARFPAGATVR